MGKIFLLAAGILALWLYPAFFYCNTRLATSASPIITQQEILRQFLDKPKNCLCKEVRVAYNFRSKDNYELQHIAYFAPYEKTLRIETDPGSGWSFGWENVDEPLLKQVLREGGNFDLLTKYRPGGPGLSNRRNHEF